MNGAGNRLSIKAINAKGDDMTFIDLFSGIGGFRRGLERSGHKCVGHVEIDKYANTSYCAMYGHATCKFCKDTGANSYMVCESEVGKNCDGENCKGEWYAKDIKLIGTGEIPKAEIWTFGFPCTDISVAGRMAEIHGERSGLFFTVISLLKGQNPEDRPKRLIVENVKHLVSSERGGAFTAVLSELWEAGYDCEWQVVNSKDFHVPQNRERVYLVGRLRGQCGGKVFPVGGANETPVKQILGKAQGNRLYDPTGLSVTMMANGGGFAGRTGLYSVSVNRITGIKDCVDTAHTLTSGDTRGINRNQDQNAVIEEKPPCRNRMKCPARGARFSRSEKFRACFIDMNGQARITKYARCIKARQYAGISNHKGETSGVFLCHGSPDCVRALITPNREEKRQNRRRMKAPGEPRHKLTGQDQHGIMLCCCEGWKQGLPIREAKRTAIAWRTTVMALITEMKERYNTLQPEEQARVMEYYNRRVAILEHPQNREIRENRRAELMEYINRDYSDCRAYIREYASVEDECHANLAETIQTVYEGMKSYNGYTDEQLAALNKLPDPLTNVYRAFQSISPDSSVDEKTIARAIAIAAATGHENDMGLSAERDDDDLDRE